MTRKYLIPKAVAQRIAKTTGALLIVQWAYSDYVSQHWNATDPERDKSTHQLQCWITLVTNDDELRSVIELRRVAQAACKGRYHLCPHIYRRKDALRQLKANRGHIATVYRCGYPLYNVDKNAFPKPGYARNEKPLPNVKRLDSTNY